MQRTAARLPITVIVAAAAVVLVAGIWFAFHLGAMSRASEAPGASTMRAARSDTPAGPAVSTARVRMGDLALSVSAQGRVGPPAGSDAKLTFAVPGIVGALDVRVGQSVERGETLAELDRSGLANAVRSAEAEVAAARAQYGAGSLGSSATASANAKLAVAQAHLGELERGGEGAQSDRISALAAERQSAIKVRSDREALGREKTLFAGGVAAQKDVDTASAELASDEADDRAAGAKVAAAGLGFAAAMRQARADVAQARADLAAAGSQAGTTGAQVQATQAKLAAAMLDYDNGVLRAPSDGVVLAILKHPGEAVDTSTAALDVGPTQSGEVTLSVPAQDAARVAVGNPVVLNFSGRDAISRGRVIAVVPNVDPVTQAGTVVVSGVPQDLAIGSSARATIVVGHASGALVPASAVVQDPQSGDTIVFVRRKSGDTPFVARKVRILATSATSAVIASGLHAGDEIATVGAYDLLAPNGG